MIKKKLADINKRIDKLIIYNLTILTINKRINKLTDVINNFIKSK